MYVTELDRPWLGTPFLFQGFPIQAHEEIEELRRYCKFVYIDIPDVQVGPPERRPRPPAFAIKETPVSTEAEQRIARDFLKIINQPRTEPVYTDQRVIEHELPEEREH